MILILGRFQPFHKGHLMTVQEALKHDKDIVIAIGSSVDVGEPYNPFSGKERKEMVEECMKHAEIKAKVVLVPDIPFDDKYVAHVEKIVGEKADSIITNSRDTAQLFGDAGYRIFNTPRFLGITGTEVRGNMASGKPWEDMVPCCVVEYIKKINGVEKVKKIFNENGKDTD